MTEPTPAVALLFDDTELGDQLRCALHERGARIVHEGKVATFSKELMEQVGADVLVVNLDDSADDALDRLYEVIDSDHPRVVFNDAQASRALAGWDRARWARHLAAKVLAVSDVDPPRPNDAHPIDVPVEAVAQPSVPGVSVVMEPVTPAPDPPHSELQPVLAETSVVITPADDFGVELGSSDFADSNGDEDGLISKSTSGAESEDLAAELEALLASAEGVAGDVDDFAEPVAAPDAEMLAVDAAAADAPAAERSASEAPLPPWHEDFRGTAVLGESDTLTESHDPLAAPHRAFPPPLPDMTAAANAAEQVPASSFAKLPAAPTSWSLVDDEAAPPLTEHLDATAFGIEKLSAADYLAPDTEQAAPSSEPFMSLQLVSMEEAVAPQAFAHDNEMLLDDLAGALSRVIALGAVDSGVDSVCEFLAALPASTRLTFIYTQHHPNQPIAAIVQRLAARSALAVHLAAAGQRARAGEVWVMPAEQQLHLRRDGSICDEANAADAVPEPSIDATFTMAAHVFGHDTVAIVFAGQATDSVAGAQAIHDRGGQVWVEASSGEYLADMVSGIFAERLVSFSGSPRDLAAHLIEVFP